jgi:hypothetical protein
MQPKVQYRRRSAGHELMGMGALLAWVVRAGEAKAIDLLMGYREHLGMPGLYGFSVQYQAGLPWQELARAGHYPNAQVSIAEDGDPRTALRSLGYDMRLISSPGAGYHHTFVVLYDATGAMLTQLPLSVAQQLHSTFTQVQNPYRVRPGRTP